MSLELRPALASVGAIVYAAAGGVIGAQNARWVDEERGANALLPLLGLGVGIVLVATRSTPLHQRVSSSPVGRVATYLLWTGALLYVVSAFVQFAILGTMTTALGLLVLACTFWARRLGALVDRALVSLSAVASLTWNTETTSAFLLVGAGLIWVVLAFRLLRPAVRT